MKKVIQNTLQEIGKQKGITILFAVESGSRGWGFSSKDSDYDVRFVYVRSKNEYLEINERADFLDFPINDELDINGWDLQKFLKLLYASNATPFEWMQSPVFYYKNNEVFNIIFEQLGSFYCQQTIIHHYLGLVRKMLSDLDNPTIKLKTLFYILRSLLAAKYSFVYTKFPSMEFSKLVHLIDKENVLFEIKRLLELKTNSSEKDISSISLDLKNFIKDTFHFLNSVDKIKSKGTFEVKVLNQTFLKILDYADN